MRKVSEEFWVRQHHRNAEREQQKTKIADEAESLRDYHALRHEFLELKREASILLFCSDDGLEVERCQSVFANLAESISRRSLFAIFARNVLHLVDTTTEKNELDEYFDGVPRRYGQGYDQLLYLLLFSVSNRKNDFKNLASELHGQRLDSPVSSYAIHWLDHIIQPIQGDQNYRRKVPNDQIKEEFDRTDRTIDKYLNQLEARFSWYKGRGRSERANRYVHEVEAAIFDHLVFIKQEIDEQQLKRLLFRESYFQKNSHFYGN